MQYTNNYNFKKPEFGEHVNITDLNENADSIDQELKNNADDITSTNQALSGHQTNEVSHIKAAEREKWNNQFNTYKSSKDENSTFQVVEKKNGAGVLISKSIFSNPNADGKYLVRTYTEYDVDGVTVTKTLVFDVVYDSDGDWISEVRRV
ncbi:hypothetical protein [Peribacillus loiseleuriae]|uniref:hypothetical protein n=1 Tax=Peribacillus loiseleuriae TaxID=1679170 RepID=UPI003D053594